MTQKEKPENKEENSFEAIGDFEELSHILSEFGAILEKLGDPC